MANSILIERRFCGPPDSGNGGYVCGRLAWFLEGLVLVRLQAPPPLQANLEVRRTSAGLELVHGGDVVAWARAAEVSLEAVLKMVENQNRVGPAQRIDLAI